MNCQHAGEELTAELTGALSEEGKRALAAHLEGCADCRAERDALARTWALLGKGDPADASPATEIDPAFLARALPRLRAEVGGAPIRRHARQTRRLVVVAGATLAMAAGFVLVARWAPAPGGTGSAPVASKEAPAARPASRAAEEAAAAPELPVELAAFVADPLAAEPGRGQAIALAGAHFAFGETAPPRELVDALVRTLRLDRNPGVRKKAAQALAALPPTADIRAAFIQTLSREPNPAIRIIAVEALGKAARELDRASIETLRERADDQQESQNLRARAARALGTLAL